MISVSADASGRLTGQAYAPKGGETQCSGIIIHIGGPALTIQGAVAAVPEGRTRASRIGEDLAPSLGSYHK